MYKLSENFYLEELVEPDILKKVGVRARDFLHPTLVVMLEELRKFTGPITINDWVFNGSFQYSGLRGPKCPIGALYSSHRFGTAVDVKCKKQPEEVVGYILDNADLFQMVTRIENPSHTPTWTHIEVGVREGDIYIFNP
ncbi:MAG: hypothetical protein D6698_15070 [Gammaproteobacteria bacterium]|nr:MAG: hypothetical protein D6698_15070 [Gammaproteobacteria bacterium]